MFKSLSLFVLIFLCSFNVFAANDPAATIDCFTKKKKLCMAVVDAGSTGSRLHVYSYTLDDASKTPINIQEVWLKTQSPGLATIVNDDKTIKDYVKGLFTAFPICQNANHSHIKKKIPLYFYGTAGMRLLNTQESIYARVMKAFKKNAIWDLQETRTITGSEEGINGWLAMNYHAGLLKPQQGNASSWAGYMDMGGASVQIVTPVSAEYFKNNDIDYVKVNVYNQELLLFAHSFLGLGQTQVTNQFLEKSNCYMHGYQMVNKTAGTGNAQSCEENIARLITQVHEVNTIVQPILQNNAPQNWYVTGGVVYTAKNKLFNFANSFTNKSLLEKAEPLCASDWETLRSDQPDNAYLYNYCLSAAYYHALMVKGYGFNPDQPIHFPQGNPEWPLGVVLQAGKQANLAMKPF